MKNIAYCCSLVQHDLQDYTTHSLSRISQFGIDCYKYELGFKAAKNINVSYLHPNDIGNAPMPQDYESLIKMSVNVCGVLLTLTVNNDITLNRTIDCGSFVQEPEAFNNIVCACQNGTFQNSTGEATGVINTLNYPGYFIGSHYRGGQYVGEQYGLTGGVNPLGYFREDFKERQFQFYQSPQYNEIILEYIGDENASVQTLIPYSAVKPIRNYIHWQLLRFNRSATQYDKQKAEALYRESFNDYKYIQFAPTMSQYLDEAWSSFQSSPKR